MGDPEALRDLHDPVRVAMRDDRLWHREKAMYAQHRINHMPCPCKICKGSRRHMAMDTVEKHLMENGRHPSLRRWRGPGARNNSDDEWDDHVRSNGASVPRCPVDRNVGLQRMFENVNAIPPEVVPPGSEDHGGSLAEQQHLPDLATNWEHAELDHHVMEVVQQTQTIVENVQAEADSMQEREGMAAASVTRKIHLPVSKWTTTRRVQTTHL